MTEVRKRRNGPEEETDKLLGENEQVRSIKVLNSERNDDLS